MANKWFIAVLIMGLLSGCSKPPDLEAPCHNFGKFCPQYPINESPIKGENA
jgi:type IV secretion system protein VirB7